MPQAPARDPIADLLSQIDTALSPAPVRQGTPVRSSVDQILADIDATLTPAVRRGPIPALRPEPPLGRSAAALPGDINLPREPSEADFRKWYGQHATALDLDPNPDSPEQRYDYRAAFRAGVTPDASGHWPSDFKKPGHPNQVVGGYDTVTGEPVEGVPQLGVEELVKLGWSRDGARHVTQQNTPSWEDGPIPSHRVDPLASLAVGPPPHVRTYATFDDSGMTKTIADAWKRVIAKYPSASKTVRAIRVNPALPAAKLDAQWLRDEGVIEISPTVTDIEGTLIHELTHGQDRGEPTAVAAERAYRPTPAQVSPPGEIDAQKAWSLSAARDRAKGARPVPMDRPAPVAGRGTGYDPNQTARELATDVGISTLKGAISVPEALVGLTDLVATGGLSAEVLKQIGFTPKEWKEQLSAGYSQRQKQSFREVEEAKGLVKKATAALMNPSTIAHTVIESAPLMLAGGAVGRGAAALRASPVVAGAIGEGVASAGSAAAQIGQETPGGRLSPTQRVAAGVSGAWTGVLGVLGGKIAQRLGIADVDTMLAGALKNRTATRGLVRQVIYGAVQEGVLEELPQSVQEQVFQNVALGQPLDKGVDHAAVMGAFTGAVMGGGANLLPSIDGVNQQPQDTKAGPTPAPVEQTAPTAPTAPVVPPGAPVAPAPQGTYTPTDLASVEPVVPAKPSIGDVLAQIDAVLAEPVAKAVEPVAEPAKPEDVLSQIDEALANPASAHAGDTLASLLPTVIEEQRDTPESLEPKAQSSEPVSSEPSVQLPTDERERLIQRVVLLSRGVPFDKTEEARPWWRDSIDAMRRADIEGFDLAELRENEAWTRNRIAESPGGIRAYIALQGEYFGPVEAQRAAALLGETLPTATPTQSPKPEAQASGGRITVETLYPDVPHESAPRLAFLESQYQRTPDVSGLKPGSARERVVLEEIQRLQQAQAPAPPAKKPVTPQIPNEPGTKYVLPSFVAGSAGVKAKPDKAFIVPKRTEDGGVTYVAEPQAPLAPQQEFTAGGIDFVRQPLVSANAPGAVKRPVAGPKPAPATVSSETPIPATIKVAAEATSSGTTATEAKRVETLFSKFSPMVASNTLPKDPRELRKAAQTWVGGDATTYTDEITDSIEAALTKNTAPVTRDVPLLNQVQAAIADEQKLPRAHRSLEKTDLQQFSTPLPIAVAAQYAANVRDADTVLEPTAGTGHLISALDPARTKILANELSPRRAALLRSLGFNVTEGDYLANTELKGKANVIITNPPWGKYTTGKYGKPIGLDFTPGDVAERFIAKNMRDLKPGGRLVAIMPTTMFGAASGGFRRALLEQGALRALIQSPPGSYRTRSTDVDSVLLVWDKGATHDPEATIKAYGTESNVPGRTNGAPQSWEAYTDLVSQVPAREVSDVADAPTIRSERPTSQPPAGRPQRPAAPAAQPGGRGGRPTSGRDDGPRSAPELGTPSVPPGRDADVVADQPGRERGELDAGRAPARAPAADLGDPTRGLSGANLDAYRAAGTSAHFAPYRLRSALTGERHPKLVVEARGLAGVDYPPLTISLTPRATRIVAEGRLSIEQAEQSLAAVQANTVHHHGYLAADNVGVGKSREIALTLVDLMERAKVAGRDLRLLVTTKSADNIKDLIDGELLQSVLGGEAPGFEVVRVPDLKASSSRYKQGPREPMPQFAHGIYVVDSYNLAAYRESLMEVGLHGIVGDEAHRFKNADAAVGATWQTLHAQIMRDVPRDQQTFAYFTATPAQSVYDYQYLYGLRLWPIDGFPDWVNVVTGQASEEAAAKVRADAEAGGRDLDAVVTNATGNVVGGDAEDTAHEGAPGRGGEDIFSSRLTPAEAEQIPREWKMLGRFSSRDLWRAGTEFNIHEATLPDEALNRYDQFAQLARDIIDAARKFGLLDKSGRSSRFGVTGQLQFAAKRIQAQPAIEEAIRLAQQAVSDGHQVVISLINVSEMNPTEGNIRAAIEQINSRNVIKTNDGFVDAGEIPEALVKKAELTEQAEALGTLDNPLDLVSDAFGEDKVAFVVGGMGGQRQTQIREYQEGKRVVAVLSAAGTTGINLDHRVRSKKGAKGRRVFIDVQYEWSATEAIQRYGRVDRASSITPPRIIALTFGAASEKKFLATIANRMSALGALSKGGAESTGAGALEEFEITGNDALMAARDAWSELDEGDKLFWKGRPFRDPNHPDQPSRTTSANMREINLALLWLPTAEANRFWTRFIERRAEIRNLMGYASEARTKALRGEIQRTIELTPQLTLFQVKNEAGHRFGIVSGIVMEQMPRLRHFLPPEGRRYIAFTAGDQVVAGLEVPVTRLKAIAKTYAKTLAAERLDTPEAVESALRAGDKLPLVHEGWTLRMRSDGLIAIDGAKMADRELLLKHGAGYRPVGNLWYVTNLPQFLERFPVKQVADEDTAPVEDVEDDEVESDRGQGGGPGGGRRGGGSSNASEGSFAEGMVAHTGRAPGRSVVGQTGSVLRPIEVPELVELARELIGTPQVVKRFRGDKRGDFRATRFGGGIRLAAELFKKGQERQLAATLAHEIGHLDDWLPDYTLKRGNLLGRLRSLKGFLKHTFTTADGSTVRVAEIRAELIALSNKWRQWDPTKASASFIAYRKSGKELYADAVSVLLNDPGLLETDAPIFYRQFFENLDTKPLVKRSYFELQELLSGTPEELIARRRGRVRGMFEEGNTKALDLETKRRAEKDAKQESFWYRFRTQHLDKHTPVNDRVEAAKAKGATIPEDEDPRYFLQEWNYVGGKMRAFVAESIQPVYRALTDAGIDWTSFGEVLFYERIMAGDRSEVANPSGLAPKDVATLHADVLVGLTTKQRTVLADVTTDFRAAMRRVADDAHAAGLYSDELYEQMVANPAYATFRVLEHIEDNVSWTVFKQKGTLKDIANVADATILKTLATIRAVERQKVRVAVFNFLTEHDPSAIAQAKEVFRGKGLTPIESKDPKQVLVYYHEKGRLRGKYVDPYIADSVNHTSMGQSWAAVKALSFVNSHWFRPVFTTMNAGFQTMNFGRDLARTWANTPDMSVRRLLQRYRQGAPLARVRAFGATPTRPQAQADLIAAEKAGILDLTWNDLMLGRDVADTEIEQILGKAGVGTFAEPPLTHGLVATPLAGVKRVLRFIEETGNFIETLPKAAGIIEYRGQGEIADISPQKRSAIRRTMGSPDFRAGGTWTPVSNNVLLFSNAYLQGWRADLDVARDPVTRSGFWWKTATLNIAPKLAMFAALHALAGGGDEDDWRSTLRRAIRGMSEYDRTNYLPVPLGFDEHGNVAYARLPQSDTGRLIGGLTWKVLQIASGDKDAMKSVTDVFSYMAGQAPTLTPAFGIAGDVVSFASGQNVYDSFRSRFLFTDDELKARDARAWKKFLGYEFQQLGGGIVWKFYPGEQRPRAQSRAQQILDFPVFSNIGGRWIKISNYGEVEHLRTIQAGVQREKARARLDEREAVSDAIRAYGRLPAAERTPAAQQRLAREAMTSLYGRETPKVQQEQYRDILKKLRMGAVRGQGDPLVDAVMGATSNDEKVAILMEASKSMNQAAFSAWLARAAKEQVISENVVAAVRVARRKAS